MLILLPIIEPKGLDTKRERAYSTSTDFWHLQRGLVGEQERRYLES
jgi:hypothetical protein